MPFHTNRSPWTNADMPQVSPQEGACGCDGRGQDPERGGDLVQAVKALAVSAKVEAALNVGDASDEQLADQLQASLDVIAKQLEQWNAKPTKDGYAPEAWLERAALSRRMRNAETAVWRNQWMARAIRSEQVNRKERAKARHEAELTDTRESLEQILRHAPREVQQAVAHAQDVIKATERIRRLVTDLSLMAGSTRLASQIDRIRSDAEIAAGALGQSSPEMPSVPDGLPTSVEVQHVLPVLLGRWDFDAIFPHFLTKDRSRKDRCACA